MTPCRLLAIFFAFTLVNASPVFAQQVKEPRTTPEWEAAYPPFRIAGNLYYVGTYDLASYLIATPKGHILINTGLAASDTLIKKNIEQLGFRSRDLKILLTSQAHYDHMGAMASIKKKTGAALMVNKKEADVLASGGRLDYELGKYGVSFAPVKADRLLKDGDTIQLGDMKLVMLHHPGHTKGSSSFAFTVTDETRSYRVLIANMPSIITDRKFSSVADYPTIAADYAYTLESMKGLSFDIWLAAHASQFSLHDKHKPSDSYRPEAFMDAAGYYKALEELNKQYQAKLRADNANR